MNMSTNNDLLMRLILASQERTLPAYIPRDLPIPLDSQKIISIMGPRRAGKTTCLYHVMEELKKKVDAEQMIYLSLENPALNPMNPQLLGDLMESYHRLYPDRLTQKKFIFLDEIQLLPDWEVAVRYLYDQENCQIWLSGSSSHLLSRDIATQLRGRSIPYLLLPFSFRELVRYHGLNPDDPHLPYTSQRFHLQKIAQDYLRFGGYPEVAQASTEDEKNRILKEYLDTMFFRDLLERFNIRNQTLMKDLMAYLFNCTGSRFSAEAYFRHIKQVYPVSKQTIFHYLSHLEDIFLFYYLRKYASSLKEQTKSQKKIFSIDPGILDKGVFESYPSMSHRLENAVWVQLWHFKACNPMNEVYYHRDPTGYEVDFVVTDGARMKSLLQVCVKVESEKTMQREIRALMKAQEQYKAEHLYLITLEQDKIAFPLPEEVKVLPFWQWALMNGSGSL